MSLIVVYSTRTFEIWEASSKNINTPISENKVWQIYGLNGRLLRKGKLAKGTQQQIINLDEFPTGVYTLKVKEYEGK